jgi:hypothetical protein
LNTPDFLKVPATVATKLAEGKIVRFEVAKEPPSVELVFHAQLGSDSIHRRLWSSWGTFVSLAMVAFTAPSAITAMIWGVMPVIKQVVYRGTDQKGLS